MAVVTVTSDLSYIGQVRPGVYVELLDGQKTVIASQQLTASDIEVKELAFVGAVGTVVWARIIRDGAVQTTIQLDNPIKVTPDVKLQITFGRS